MTQEADARAKFASARAVAASVTILAIAAIVAPQIDAADDLQRSLTITTIVFAVIGLALYLWCFATSREIVARRVATLTIGETAATIRDNRPLVLLCASALLFLTGMFSVSTVAVYYARDVLGDANLYIVLTLVQTVAMVGASILVPAAVSAIGKRRAYVIAGVIAALGAALFAVAPASTPAIAIGAYALVGLGFGAINALIFAFQADTVDYGEWHSGVRAEGGNYAVLSFTRKAGQAVGGAAAAFTIGLGGYVSGAVAQGESAVAAIRVAAGIVPAIGVGGAAAIMLAYPLTDERFREIVGELATRHGTAQDRDPSPAGTS
jgi:glucuronide carrier protein